MSTDQSLVDGLGQLIDRAVEAAVERRLASEPKAPPDRVTAPALPTFLTIHELADLLRLGTLDADGRRTGGIRTIRQWIAEGRIPYRRANGRVLFLLEDVLEWTRGSGAEGGERGSARGVARRSSRAS